MWPVGGQVGEARDAWRNAKSLSGRLYLPKMLRRYTFPFTVLTMTLTSLCPETGDFVPCP